MTVKIEESKLKEGLLGLVIALVEIICEVLKLQAVKRISAGNLDYESVERLGQTLMDMEGALESLKIEQGIEESVTAIRNNLDDIIDDFLESFSPVDSQRF